MDALTSTYIWLVIFGSATLSPAATSGRDTIQAGRVNGPRKSFRFIFRKFGRSVNLLNPARQPQGHGRGTDGHHNAGQHHGMGDRVRFRTGSPCGDGYQKQKNTGTGYIQCQDFFYQVRIDHQSVKPHAQQHDADQGV